MEKYKEQIEKEAAEFASKHISNDKSTVSWCLEEGLKKAFESEVMQRVKADFAISVLHELMVHTLVGSAESKRIDNKITELKNSINGK